MDNFDVWLDTVRGILLKERMITGTTTLCEKSWRPLFDDRLSPAKAVAVNMGCEAKLAWA